MLTQSLSLTRGMYMEIIVKPLTPEMSDDYFDFFENRAFTDDSPYRCYCQIYQMTAEQADKAYSGVDGEDMGRVARQLAQAQIASGALKGYLAYDGDIAVGWCNANDIVNYAADSNGGARFLLSESRQEKGLVKAVVCFEIAPSYRMKGIATMLLRRVCEDAEKDGFVAVESFPDIRGERFEWDCFGPVRLYEKQGFRMVSQGADTAVMRKELR